MCHGHRVNVTCIIFLWAPTLILPKPKQCMQEWQIDVPWPEDPGAPWELLKWFAELVQSVPAPEKPTSQKQR